MSRRTRKRRLEAERRMSASAAAIPAPAGGDICPKCQGALTRKDDEPFWWCDKCEEYAMKRSNNLVLLSDRLLEIYAVIHANKKEVKSTAR